MIAIPIVVTIVSLVLVVLWSGFVYGVVGEAIPVHSEFMLFASFAFVYILWAAGLLGLVFLDMFVWTWALA